MRRLTIAAAALLAAGGVTGCVNVLPEAGPAAQIYRLEAGPTGRAMTAATLASAQVGRSLYSELTVVIPEPLASRALSTDRVAVITSGDHLSYAAGARWGERAPLIVQDRILTAFEDDGRVGAAVVPEDGVQTDYELRFDMIRFEAVYQDGDEAAPTAVIELRAKLVDRRTRDLLASRRFSGERTADANRMGSIIGAFDVAMDGLGPEIVDWTLTAAAAGAAEPQPSASAASSSR